MTTLAYFTSVIYFSVEKPTSMYYITAEMKWKSVFHECRDRLGYQGDVEPDLKKAWRCVSQDLSRGPTARSPRQEREVIDEVLRGVDLDQARKIGQDQKKLQEYLSKVRVDFQCCVFLKNTKILFKRVHDRPSSAAQKCLQFLQLRSRA